MKKRFFIVVITIAVLLGLCQAGLLVIIRQRANDIQRAYDVSPQPLHRAVMGSLDYYDEAYQQAWTPENPLPGKIYGGIIPHHLFVKNSLAGYFSNIPTDMIETVVLISPNHFNRGSDDILIGKNDWETPYGVVVADRALIAKLQTESNALLFKVDETPFDREHGIAGLIPFVKKSLPQAKVVPVIMKVGASASDEKAFADLLARTVNPEKTLVLGSVDFSHYQPLNVAAFHDEKSIATIKSFDFNEIKKLEIDSPPTIFTVLRYVDQIGVNHAETVFHTNSSELLAQPDMPGTSHVFFTFSKGERANTSPLSFLFTGSIERTWQSKDELTSALAGVAGEELRFFRGFDVVTSTLNPSSLTVADRDTTAPCVEPACVYNWVTELQQYGVNVFQLRTERLTKKNVGSADELLSVAQNRGMVGIDCSEPTAEACRHRSMTINGKKISFVQVAVNSLNTVDSVKNDVAIARASSAVVVVQVTAHDETSEVQTQYAHAAIDAGADVVVGDGNQYSPGIDVYRDKPIVYALGSLVSANEHGSGLVVGLHLTNTDWDLALFPVAERAGKAILLGGDEKAAALHALADDSGGGDGFKQQIIRGTLRLSK